MKTISRRTFFRRATPGAGSVLLAPLLQQISAAPTAAKPKRFVFVMEGDGLNPLQLQPLTIPRAKHPHGHNHNDKLQDIALAGPISVPLA